MLEHGFGLPMKEGEESDEGLQHSW